MMGTLLQNRYRIDVELGRGGMGTVYRATDTQTGELVAVKALNPDCVTRDPELLERFTREGEALRQLNHPNIVRMVAAVEEGGQHYLVMEYVAGGSLSDVLEKEGRLPTQRAVEIALDLADALTRAHRLGILHRDLKPENVLLAADGTPRLADFGLARLPAGLRLTQSGILMGTVDYVSPEACRGDAPDERSDIWSFGVLLFEMLAGRVPFGGDTFAAKLNAILTQPVPDLGPLAPGVPDALADLAYRMLDKDRQQRIPSVRLVGAELEALLKGREPARHASRFTSPTPPAGGPRHNLPAQATPFVGREAELRELDRLLSDPAVRLATIVGLGGMGKTRLALEAASGRLGQQRDGVWFVPLAALQTAEALVPAIAQALGTTLQDRDDPRQQLLDYLRTKDLLLILDNCEHLVANQGTEIARLVPDILESAPGLRIVTTSRLRLGLAEEHVMHLAGMDLPDGAGQADVTESGAVRLFVQGARRARPGFELAPGDLSAVARICRLVAGQPLALLLAAAWVDLLSAAEIAAEIERGLDFLETDLSSAPQRQRSIRTVFDYSWRLLSERGQEVCAGLAVFRGGFTRDAAQAVTGATLRELKELVDKCLLQRNPAGRYSMHELVRQFAGEKLRTSGAADVLHRRHLDHYLAAARDTSEDLFVRQRVDSVRRLAADRDNFLAALEWSLASGDPLSGLKLSHRLCDFWSAFTSLGERRAWLERLLSASAEPTLERASGLRQLGQWLHLQGEYGRALAVCEASLALFEALGDRPGTADAVFRLSWPVMALGDAARARSLMERSLSLYRELGRPREVALAIMMLGEVARSERDWARARELDEQSVALLRGLNDPFWLVWALGNLGFVLLHFDEIGRARDLLAEGLALGEEVGGEDVAFYLTGFASVANRQGQPLKAATLVGAADALRAARGRPIDPGDLPDYEELMATLRAQLGQEVLAAAYAKGQALSREEAVALSLSDEP